MEKDILINDRKEELLNGLILIEEVDKFKNQTDVYTFDLWINGIGYYGYMGYRGEELEKKWQKWRDERGIIPYDILFRSNPFNEELYIIDGDGICSMTIRINDTTNIVLEEYITECEKRLFHISKTDFLRCCNAKTMAIQSTTYGGSNYVGNDDYMHYQILAFRTIWNKTIDSTMFIDSVKEYSQLILSRVQSGLELLEMSNQLKEERVKEEKKEKKKEKNQVIIAILIGIFIAFGIIGLIFCLS